MSYQIGPARYRLVVKKPIETRDSYGQVDSGWNNPAAIQGTYWASLHQLAGREYLYVKQLWAEATHVIEMRWPGYDIFPDWRLEYTRPVPTTYTRIFNIINVENHDERNRYLRIVVKEIKVTPALLMTSLNQSTDAFLV